MLSLAHEAPGSDSLLGVFTRPLTTRDLLSSFVVNRRDHEDLFWVRRGLRWQCAVSKHLENTVDTKRLYETHAKS